VRFAMQRPTDITILAVLSAIDGVLGLLGSLALIAMWLVIRPLALAKPRFRTLRTEYRG